MHTERAVSRVWVLHCGRMTKHVRACRWQRNTTHPLSEAARSPCWMHPTCSQRNLLRRTRCQGVQPPLASSCAPTVIRHQTRTTASTVAQCRRAALPQNTARSSQSHLLLWQKVSYEVLAVVLLRSSKRQLRRLEHFLGALSGQPRTCTRRNEGHGHGTPRARLRTCVPTCHRQDRRRRRPSRCTPASTQAAQARTRTKPQHPHPTRSTGGSR
jgi:hypothetical protein